MEKIYVIGHKNPDTDTTISAIAMANFLNTITRTENYIPVTTAKINSETEFVLNKFGYVAPEILEDATDKKLFLVDHNEQSQWVNGASAENILGFVDHHKIKFENSFPIEIITKPWGCTCTIIYYLFEGQNIEVPKELKPLMLCAMLSDTVILKSVTTTKRDKKYVEDISQELEIDYKEIGMEMFKAKAQISNKTADEIIHNDFKNFDFNAGKFGIGQIETPDLTDVVARADEIKSKMQELVESEGYHSMIIMLTDIIEVGSKLLVVSKDENKIAEIFNTTIDDGLSEFLPSVMSRKKQIMPKLSEKF
ncbi:manganese-dependent inorganic pyrophosphatase [archaeon]|nr:manganese-dependent inorganic pyrophosphatase [archaeon]MBT4351452.1 manganese-dependent inorganic pyrophosphatase [archaeon]MBT4646700.1 manganese-dependent inorganic pyrophosphatase [archaeon]MBT6821850.1 manganese-dependent inorganic pyrophosphatase [archaeon]MBT7392260.1 manganese-dependent inorganic pyrophosphatase [archaeon]